MSFTRRALQVTAFICTLLVGVTSMALIVTQTTWFKQWLRGFIVRQAEDFVDGRLSIGRLDGNLFFGVELEDVDVTRNGKPVVAIRNVGLDYNAFSFFGGDVALDEIRLNEPVVHLERTADGWNVARLIRARTPDPDEPKSRRAIAIGRIGITNGTVHLEGDVVGASGLVAPSRIDRLDASVGVTTDENELTIDIAHASFRAAQPELGVQALTAVIRRTADELAFDNVSLRTDESSLRAEGRVTNVESGTPVIDLTAASDTLALDEIARLVPALRGYEMQPAIEVTAEGPADRLAVHLNVSEGRLGHATGDLVVDAIDPSRRVAGTLDVRNLDVGPLVKSPTLKSDITGQARIDLALPTDRLPLSGTYAVNAGHVQVAGYEVRDLAGSGRIDGRTIRVDANATAYGGRASAAGTVVAGQPLALDLTGRASNVDLRNLPPSLNVPDAPSDIDADYTLTARGPEFSGDVRFHESTVAGAAISPGTTATFRLGAGAPAYSSKGQVANLDVQQIGQGFDITPLAAGRFRSRVDASFDLTGTGGGQYPLTIDAEGTVTDSEMFGASFPRLDVTTNIANGDARVRANGQFAGLDPAVVTGNDRVAGSLEGMADVETTFREYASGVTFDSIDAAGRVDLGRSMIGGLAIDTAVVDGRYANREGHLTQVTVTGPDVNVSGQGAIALNDTGASSLTLHAESASLDRIGRIVGQPLVGAAIVDATMTGNARELQVKGTLQGSNLGHGENKALAVESTFAATVPDLQPADATIQATTKATFVEVVGQGINEVTADTTYSASRLEFNAVAREGMGELTAAGDVVFHPDHQEIHLSDVVLRAEQIEWRTTPGSETTVRYGGDRIEVGNLQLVSGDQRVTAEGVIGSPTESLRVHAENVDVAQLDRLMLGDRRLAGRIAADATISGTTSAPRVAAEFTLSQGAFQTFMFESFAGSMDYAERGVDLDVRLQQTPAAWITAKGRAPVTLFRPTPTDVAGAHEVPAPGEEVDIQIASSEIDLGVVQGLTSVVMEVTGVMQANLTLTGSGNDPHVNGTIDIRGGAFAVPELGTSYTGLDTRIDLQNEQVAISEFKILDNRGAPMTVGGTLAVHARELGVVDIRVQSESFGVIDNELADLRLDTDLRITGELRKPRLEGTIEVESGTIHVAPLVERTTSARYATDDAEGVDDATAPEPSLFDALEMNVDLNVPSNLILSGNDIRPADAPIEFGDMNATVGGDLQVRKESGSPVAITGEVNIVRGSYTFQGRRFELLRDGRIRFAGTDEIDPILDVRARRVISGVEAFVRVQGTMRQPELSFSSNPPLDQADILSLIVFNQPINQLGTGDQASLVERAGALAGGYLTSGLSRSIGNALELDEFEIQAQGEGGGPSLSVGEQVGEQLFVRVRQGFGDAQATEFILEYQIADFLRLQGTAAETAGAGQRVTFRRVERGGIDLIFFFSY